MGHSSTEVVSMHTATGTPSSTEASSPLSAIRRLSSSPSPSSSAARSPSLGLSLGLQCTPRARHSESAPPPYAGSSPDSCSSAQQRPPESTLAKRPLSAAAATTRSSPTNASSIGSSNMRPYTRHDDEDDEDDALITEDDMSIENYMRRHPCVLDRGSAFLDRHPWVYQASVLALTFIGVIFGSLAASGLAFSRGHFIVMYIVIALDLALYVTTCRRSPGRAPSCPDEASVVRLLHAWPAATTAHHYGLHASEWSRSWSFCNECTSWRPARAHHCRKCGHCVLLMDHHCVWVGTCVGANNLRYFASYVGLTCALGLYGLGLAVEYARTARGSFDLLVFLGLLITALIAVSAAGWLLARCARILLVNETGIEGLKKTSARDEKRARAQGRTLTKESMMHNSGGNGSISSAIEMTDKKTDDVTSSTDGSGEARFFSPFQCECHAASFRVLYCSSFNYPVLSCTASPVPPLPFYHDYSAARGEWRMNAHLFESDRARAQQLHAWIERGPEDAAAKKTPRHMMMLAAERSHLIPPPPPQQVPTQAQQQQGKVSMSRDMFL